MAADGPPSGLWWSTAADGLGVQAVVLRFHHLESVERNAEEARHVPEGTAAERTRASAFAMPLGCSWRLLRRLLMALTADDPPARILVE